MNAILAKLKNCYLESILQLGSKIPQLKPTTPARLSVKTQSARCLYYQM